MEIIQKGAVASRGIGHPDYSNQIASGQIRPGLSLKTNQRLLFFTVIFSDIISPFPTILPVLAPGAIEHFIDGETGLAMPYTTLPGYKYSIIQIGQSADQDFRNLIYIDTAFFGYFGVLGSGVIDSTADVIQYSTDMIDPLATTAHLIDFRIENLGGDNLIGGGTIFCLEEKIGSPPRPSSKTVQCKWCKHKWDTSWETTSVNCPACGQLNIFFDFSRRK